MRYALLFLVLLAAQARAQQNDIPLQRDIYIDVERNAARLDARIHSGLKPLMESRADLTHVLGYRTDSAKYYYIFTEKLLKEHLLIVDEPDFRLTLDPMLHQEAGFDLGDATRYPDTSRFYFNGRGFWLRGDIGGKVSFQTMFQENQGLMPQYLYRFYKETNVLPGLGRVKLFDGRKVDFGLAQGNVAYAPAPWIAFRMGHGKRFVGHGYRSMLLSDNAIPVPYAEMSLLSPNKRWQYTTWHAKLMHGVSKYDRLPTGESSESLFYWMRARFHHLSVDLGRVQLGLFEATLFRTIDSEGVRPFDPMELNPIIGLNTAAYGFGKGTKCLVGTDLRLKLTDKAYAYGQWATDGPGRFAWQAGVRAFYVLRKDLHVQLEYNAATPYMYTAPVVRQAYMQAGQPLAHPRGTAFGEAVAIVDAGFGRLWLQGKLLLAAYQVDTGGVYSHGTSLEQTDTPRPSPEGPLTRHQTFVDASASYLVNPSSNFRLVLGCMRRDVPGSIDAVQSTYVYLAVRTMLFNRYYDF